MSAGKAVPYSVTTACEVKKQGQGKLPRFVWMIYYIRVHCAQLLNSGFYLFVIDQVRVEELIWITYSTGMIQYSMTELLTLLESIIHLPFLRISTSKLVLCVCYCIQSPRHQQNRQRDQEVDSPPRRRIRRDVRRKPLSMGFRKASGLLCQCTWLVPYLHEVPPSKTTELAR